MLLNPPRKASSSLPSRKCNAKYLPVASDAAETTALKCLQLTATLHLHRSHTLPSISVYLSLCVPEFVVAPAGYSLYATMPASLAAATSSAVVLSVKYNVIRGMNDLLAAGTASRMRASYSFACDTVCTTAHTQHGTAVQKWAQRSTVQHVHCTAQKAGMRAAACWAYLVHAGLLLATNLRHGVVCNCMQGGRPQGMMGPASHQHRKQLVSFAAVGS